MTYYDFKRFILHFLRFFANFLEKNILLLIISCFLILLVFSSDSHVNATSLTTFTYDVEDEVIEEQRSQQNEFILFCYYPFIEKTDSWNNLLKPIFDDIKDNNYDIQVSMTKRGTTSVQPNYVVYTYYYGRQQYTDNTYAWNMKNGGSVNITWRRYGVNMPYYHVVYTPESDLIQVGHYYTSNTVDFPLFTMKYKSDMWLHFMELIYGGSDDYSVILSDISNYLSDLDTNTSDIYTTLQSILTVVQTIAQKNPTDYTSQITGITNQVSNINSSIQTQTQQQHQDSQATQNAINAQTQQQHQDAQATQNTIEESTNSILSTEADEITMDDFGVSSPTIEGSPDLTNIFNLLYNSFMTVYEDNIYRIQFKLPSGDTIYNYDIPANALRDKLPERFNCSYFCILVGCSRWCSH